MCPSAFGMVQCHMPFDGVAPACDTHMLTIAWQTGSEKLLPLLQAGRADGIVMAVAA